MDGMDGHLVITCIHPLRADFSRPKVSFATYKKVLKCSDLQNRGVYLNHRNKPVSPFRLGLEKSGGSVEFKQMEVTDIVSVVALRNFIFNQHGQIDILVNNAAVFFYPSQDPTEHYCQVQRTLDIKLRKSNLAQRFSEIFI